ncbi:MAG: hypothetical protein OXN97_15690 [Bryobacterales bacterium]|nr:hypothetical protein [Bryobacterales bacterium]
MNRPSPRWRYMADASYWIYIVHVPTFIGKQLNGRRYPRGVT